MGGLGGFWNMHPSKRTVIHVQYRLNQKYVFHCLPGYLTSARCSSMGLSSKGTGHLIIEQETGRQWIW